MSKMRQRDQFQFRPNKKLLKNSPMQAIDRADSNECVELPKYDSPASGASLRRERREASRSSIGTPHSSLDVSVHRRNTAALGGAVAYGDAIKQQLVASGELIPTDTLSKLLGVSRKGLKDRNLFSLMVGRRKFYPQFFADGRLFDAGLGDVLASIANRAPWSQWLFLTTPSGFLAGLTPIEALKQKRRREVLAAVHGYLEP